MPEETVRRLDGFRDRLLGRAAAAHPPTSRSARLTALRTSGSLSCAARSSTARASGVRTVPSALAAQARVAGSSFLPSSPLAASIFSSTGTPRAPTSDPKASKNVIFSVRSAFLSFEPVTMLSTRGAAGGEHGHGLEAQKRRPDGEDDVLRSLRVAGGRARRPGAGKDARGQRATGQEGGPGDARLRGQGAGHGP